MIDQLKNSKLHLVSRTHFPCKTRFINISLSDSVAVNKRLGMLQSPPSTPLWLDIIKAGDFGLGRVPQPFTSGSMTAHGCGTPAYSAPEAFMPNGNLTPASGIYSLGITGIELMTGSTKRESIKDFWINNDVTQLLWEMTSWTPSARPDAATVVSRITNITQTYNKNFNTVVGAGIVGVLGWLLFKGD